LYAVGVLFGDSVFVQFMALVASKFPDVKEVFPEVLDEFLGPGLTRVGLRAFAVSVVCFLVVDDGLGNTSLEKVLPPDRLLVFRLEVKGSVPGVW
jgi:hypothetical protein